MPRDLRAHAGPSPTMRAISILASFAGRRAKGDAEEDLAHKDAEFMILISGTDETFLPQMVHSRTSYRKSHEDHLGAKFRPIFVESPLTSWR